MKKIIFIVISLFAIDRISAQVKESSTNDINGVEPPSVVAKKFNTDHPNVSPLWNMEDDNFSAGYKDEINDVDKVVVYDRYGNIISINNEIKSPSYPKAINDYYSKNHPEEKEFKVWSSEDPKGKKTYYAKHKTSTLFFDENGKYLKTKQDKTKTAAPTYKPNPNKPK
jgi:hypothetical protein